MKVMITADDNEILRGKGYFLEIFSHKFDPRLKVPMESTLESN